MQEENNVIEKRIKNEEAYDINDVIEEQEEKKQRRNYYDETIYALIQYMKNNEKNPSEKKWDEVARKEEYLSSKTIGYVSGIGFNKLCRNLRKEINRSKRQQNF